MSINRAEKITIWTAFIAIISFILSRMFHAQLYHQIPEKTYLFVHSGVEFISFAVCFTMLVLGWLFFLKSLSRQRLYTAALFSVVGLFDMLHALTMEGMPFFRFVGDTTLSMMFASTAQVVGSVGLFLIFRKNDNPISASKRLPVVSAALGMGFVLAAFYFSLAGPPAPHLLTGLPLHYIRSAIELIIVLAYMATIGTIMYRNRNEQPKALLTIVQSLVFFLFANLQFILGENAHDTDMLLGHIYKLAGYYF